MKKDELNFLKLTDEDEIRFYEGQGILGESDGYDDSSVEKIALIALLRKAGLSPEQTADPHSEPTPTRSFGCHARTGPSDRPDRFRHLRTATKGEEGLKGRENSRRLPSR